MPFSGIKPGSKLERDIDECVVSIRADDPGMGKSQAIAICRSRLEKKMSEQEKEKEIFVPSIEMGGKAMHPDRRHRKPDSEHDKDDDDGPMSDGFINFGATSFAQLREARRAQKAAQEVRQLANEVPELVESILQDPNIEDKETAIADLGPEFSAFVLEEMDNNKERWQPLTDAVVNAISPLIDKIKGKDKDEDIPPSVRKEFERKSDFSVYKEADGGYRWTAIYSNKFRDRDNPPEIISEASHIAFVKAVNSGELPFPELWLFHVDGSKWGEADFVGYDDNGFAVATGTVDKGKEWVADALMAFEGDLLTSHGMPPGTTKREPQDPTIIIGHITKEISPLPAYMAANEHTGFSILDEVKQMAFTEQDKARLTALGVDADRLEAETESKAADTEDLEHKETDKPEGDFVSRDEVSDLVKSVANSTNQLVQVVGDLAKRIETLEAGKLVIDKATLEATPAASLADLYKSVIGSEEAKIDGRTKLARSGPEEAPVDTAGSRYGEGLSAIIVKRNQEVERGVQ